MALQFNVPTSTPDDLTLQLQFTGDNGPLQTEIRETFLPAEWFPQSGVQLTWPHAATDWNYMLPEVTECYLHIAYEIAVREKLLIVSPEPEKVKQLLTEKLPSHILGNIRWAQCPTNDTWARDHGFITLLNPQGALLLDFRFNGWGMKFAANWDNRINRRLTEMEILKGEYVNYLDFVLEGGSVESDGAGTILTTSECLLSPNRNDKLGREEIEDQLKKAFNVRRVLWLDHGYLAGDDTDSHVDTLARFCPNQTIAYVQCTDTEDEHFQALQRMEEQLRSFRTENGEPYRLIPLPLPEAIYDENGQRLPATYANFLIVNQTVLMPTYGQPQNDEKAHKALQKAFPKYGITCIDCRALIRQHGSLHCCTMQFPVGVIQ